MAKQFKTYLKEEVCDYVAGFKKIQSSHLEGIEWLTDTLLYLSWPLLLSFWLQKIIFRSRPSLTIEVYVVGCVAVTVACWWFPTLPRAIVCSYLSLSTVVVLLHVVFLSKVLGPVKSTERSLILFICNITQIVFTFSIWYQLEADLTRWDALLTALLVLGTLGYPHQAKALVGLQIATDFLLLAIFLAHLVGRVGYQQKDK
jgi:hypothetical protein